MSALLAVLIIAGLIAANGLFVAAEFAMVGASRPRIQGLAAAGRRGARRVVRVLASPALQDRYIATAQLGITLASLGLGMYGEHRLATWLYSGLQAGGLASWPLAHSAATVLSVALLTYLHIVLGEMVPKSLALQHAEPTALAISAPMRALERLLLPLVVVLNGVGNGLLRLLGVDRTVGAEDRYTAAELADLVRESDRAGLLGAVSGRVARQLFEFLEHTAEQAMVPRVQVVGVPLGAGPRQVADIVRRAPHTRYPVFEEHLDATVGAVHVKDLLLRARTGRAVDREGLRPLPQVPGTLPLSRVLEVMRRERVQIVSVMDEFGGTAGLLTIEDLFEELLGELDEEQDGMPEIRRLPDGALLVDGTARLQEVGEVLGRVLDHEEVESVSGLVLHLVGRPARAGDKVVHAGVAFEVLALAGQGVGLCRVTLTSDGELVSRGEFR